MWFTQRLALLLFCKLYIKLYTLFCKYDICRYKSSGVNNNLRKGNNTLKGRHEQGAEPRRLRNSWRTKKETTSSLPSCKGSLFGGAASPQDSARAPVLLVTTFSLVVLFVPYRPKTQPAPHSLRRPWRPPYRKSTQWPLFKNCKLGGSCCHLCRTTITGRL